MTLNFNIFPDTKVNLVVSLGGQNLNFLYTFLNNQNNKLRKNRIFYCK